MAVLLGSEHGSPGSGGEDARGSRVGFVLSADRMGASGGRCCLCRGR